MRIHTTAKLSEHMEMTPEGYLLSLRGHPTPEILPKAATREAAEVQLAKALGFTGRERLRMISTPLGGALSGGTNSRTWSKKRPMPANAMPIMCCQH